MIIIIIIIIVMIIIMISSSSSSSSSSSGSIINSSSSSSSSSSIYIWRQGIVLKRRNSLQRSLCPVVICPYLCSSDSFRQSGKTTRTTTSARRADDGSAAKTLLYKEIIQVNPLLCKEIP